MVFHVPSSMVSLSLGIFINSAYNVLTNPQKDTINKYAKIVFSSLNTIETYGGGSARCMMAEVFLPKAK